MQQTNVQQSNLREAFSMITAIFVMVIMATVGAFVMSLSGKIVKSTTTQYQHEQAELYAKSYTEYAILAVTGNDRTVNCLTTITGNIGNINLGGYDANVSIQYIGTASALGTCTSLGTSNTVSAPLTIIIDAYVDYKDPDNTGQTLTVHRRTVQKI